MTEPVQAPSDTRRRAHDFKVWPEYYSEVLSQVKTFEVRKDDRGGFHVGDVLALCEWDPATGSYTGLTCHRVVTYVLPGGQFGIEQGYAVLGIAPW